MPVALRAEVSNPGTDIAESDRFRTSLREVDFDRYRRRRFPSASWDHFCHRVAPRQKIGENDTARDTGIAGKMDSCAVNRHAIKPDQPAGDSWLTGVSDTITITIVPLAGLDLTQFDIAEDN